MRLTNQFLSFRPMSDKSYKTGTVGAHFECLSVQDIVKKLIIRTIAISIGNSNACTSNLFYGTPYG